MGINTNYPITPNPVPLAFVSPPSSAEIEAARKSLERIFHSKWVYVSPATVAPLIPKLLQIGGVGISFLINEAVNAAPVGLEEIPWIRQNSLKRLPDEFKKVGLTDALDRFVMNQDNLPPDISRQDVFAQLHNLKAGINAHHFSRALEAFVYLSAMLGFNQKEFEAGLEALLIHFPEQIQKPTSPNHQQRVDQQRDPPPQSTRRTTNAQHQPKSYDTPLTLTLNGQTSQVFFRTTQNSAGSQYSVFYNPGNGVREHKLQAKTLEGARIEFMQLYKQGDLPGMSAGATQQAYNASLTLKDSSGKPYRVTIRQEADKQFTVNYTIHGQEHKFSLEATTREAASKEVNKAFKEGRLPGLFYSKDTPRPPKVETPKPANPASQVEPSVGGMTPEELTTFLGNLGLLQPVEEFLTQNPNATPEQVQQFLSTRLAQNYQAFLEKNGFREYVLQRYGSNPTDEQLIQAERDFLKAHASRNGTANNGSDPNLAEVMGAIAENLMKQDPDLSINDAYYKAGILLNEGGSGGGKKPPPTGGGGGNGSNGPGGNENPEPGGPRWKAWLAGAGKYAKEHPLFVLVGVGTAISVTAQFLAASPPLDGRYIDQFRIPLDKSGQPNLDGIKLLSPEEIIAAGGDKADLNAPDGGNGYVDLNRLPEEFFYNVDNIKKLRRAINIHYANQMLAAEMRIGGSTDVNLQASYFIVFTRILKALADGKDFGGSTNDMNHPSYWGRTQPAGVVAQLVTVEASNTMRHLDELVAQNRMNLYNGTQTGFPKDLTTLAVPPGIENNNPTNQLISRAGTLNASLTGFLNNQTAETASELALQTERDISLLTVDIGNALSVLNTSISQIVDKNRQIEKYQQQLQMEANLQKEWSGVEPNQITQKLTQLESIKNANNTAIANLRAQISSLQMAMNTLQSNLVTASLQAAGFGVQLRAAEQQLEQLKLQQQQLDTSREAIRTAENNQAQANQNTAWGTLQTAISHHNAKLSSSYKGISPPAINFGGSSVTIRPAIDATGTSSSWNAIVNELHDVLFRNRLALDYAKKNVVGLSDLPLDNEAEQKKYIEKLLKERLGEAAARYEGSPVVSPGSSPIDPDRPENRQPDPNTPNTPDPNPVSPEGGRGEPVPDSPIGPTGLEVPERGTLVAYNNREQDGNNKLFFLEHKSYERVTTTSGSNIVSSDIVSNPEDNVLSIGEMFARANERNIELKRARQEILQDKELINLLNDPDFRISLGANFSGNQLLGGQSLSPLLNALTISVPLYNAKNRGAKANAAAKLQLSIAALVNQETQVKKQIIDTRLKYYQTLSDLEKQQKLVDSLNRQIVDTRTLEDVGAISPGSTAGLEKQRNEKLAQIVTLNAQLDGILADLARVIGVPSVTREQMPPLNVNAPPNSSTTQALVQSQPTVRSQYRPTWLEKDEPVDVSTITQRLIDQSGWLKSVPVKGKDGTLTWVNANEITYDQFKDIDMPELERVYAELLKTGQGSPQAMQQIAQILYLNTVRQSAGASGEIRLQFNPLMLLGIVANPLLALFNIVGSFTHDQTNEREVVLTRQQVEDAMMDTLKLGDEQTRRIELNTQRLVGDGYGSTNQEANTKLQVLRSSADIYFAIQQEVKNGLRSADTKDPNSYGGVNMYEAYRNLVEALYEFNGVTFKYLALRTELATLSGQNLDDLSKIYDGLFNPTGGSGIGVVTPPVPGIPISTDI